MEWYYVLALLLGTFVLLMATGLPIPFTFLAINLVAAYVLWNGVAGLLLLVHSMFESVSTFVLVPIPLFVLLGELVYNSGIGMNTIDALDKWMGRMPGRLCLLAVGSATIFASMTGSSMATSAMLAEVLVPDMERRGYSRSMCIGPIMGSGGLAIMIPPSSLAVLLASLGRIPVGDMLIGGIVPGLLMALFFSIYIIVRCTLQPSVAPPYMVPTIRLSEKIVSFVWRVLPLGLIVFMVIGLIFLGICTPSEAAAMGALAAFVLAMLYKSMNWEVIKKSLVGTARLTVMIFMIISGAKAFAQILAFSGATEGLIELAVSLPLAPIFVIIIMQVTIMFLGCFMDVMAIMMITLPIFMPVVVAFGFDTVWFGVIMLLNIEMAFITPPFGLLLFVMKGVAPVGTTMTDIYLAGLPFIGCDILVMALLTAFPAVVLWLPGLL